MQTRKLGMETMLLGVEYASRLTDEPTSEIFLLSSILKT